MQFAILSLILCMSVSALGLATTNRPRSLAVMKNDLTRSLDCHWQDNAHEAVCAIKDLRGSIGLISDDQGKTVETIEVDALLVGTPKRQIKEEQVSHRVILKLVNYLFPDWEASSSWTENALLDISKGTGRHIMKMGEYTILIQAHQFVDLDGNFAEIVISKKSSAISDAE